MPVLRKMKEKLLKLVPRDEDEKIILISVILSVLIVWIFKEFFAESIRPASVTQTHEIHDTRN